MSARIAPVPIKAGLSAAADNRSRSVRSDSDGSVEGRGAGGSPQPQQEPAAQPQLPAMPPPPPPPGAAFAVALITGQLPPKPTSEREILLRLGSADLPAQGSLALHDRLV